MTFEAKLFFKHDMLKELYLKNLAVIDEQRLEFTQGFQVLTGETGAGKSILVEAIGLILGQKARPDLIRDGAKEAIIEACFDITGVAVIQELLAQEEFTNDDDNDELIIKRHISLDGKNKIFVNQQRTTLVFLQRLTNLLIDFTGQLQQTQLLDSSQDGVILDSFLPDISLLKKYQTVFLQAKNLRDDIVELQRKALQKTERLSWLEIQYKDFKTLSIFTEEDELELKQLRNRKKNTAVIQEFSHFVSDSLTGGNTNVVLFLQKLQDQMERYDVLQELYGKFRDNIEDIRIRVEDLSYEIAKTSHLSSDDERLSLDDVDEKLYQLERLKKKHGPNLLDVLQKKQSLEIEIEQLKHSDDRIDLLKKEFENAFCQVRELASQLTQQRQQAILFVEKAIQKELKFLNMLTVKFLVQVDTGSQANDFSAYSLYGLDQVRFLLSTNPGLAPRPLSKVASGGETSRIFLALKQVLSQHKPSRTYIFDEIDTGLSGAAGELVGQKLKTLAKHYQVFCVTHNAQIASLADSHYLVHKKSSKKSTITRVSFLDQEQRVQEVARLMGGVNISEKNLAYASELIKDKLQDESSA